MFGNDELVKIKISVFDDDGFEGDGKVWEPGEGVFIINPESYKESFTINYGEDQAPGTSGNDLKFASISPGELSFKFLFDSTGLFNEGTSNNTNSNEEDEGVSKAIDNFREHILSFNGDIHQPKYLRLQWAYLYFECKLTKLEINHQLFNAGGYPIRAVATITCIGTINHEKREAEEGKNSPDLTHVRTVKEGDTLPLLTHSIYGDSKYYLEVAKANNLLSFRKLTPGQTIYFPPINKIG